MSDGETRTAVLIKQIHEKVCTGPTALARTAVCSTPAGDALHLQAPVVPYHGFTLCVRACLLVTDCSLSSAGVCARSSLPSRVRTLQLEASGKKAEIETELARKLNECGWRDDIKQKCFEIIEQRGKDNITVDELVVLIAPAGRASVPDALKADMLGTMKDFVQSLDL